MSLFRPTANMYGRKLCCLLAICVGLLGVASAPAVAAVCPGQTFSQPFAAFKDSNYYTLVKGSQFNAGPEGWELGNGASVVAGTRPGGSSGGVLNLPSGSYAVSPPVCVTLQYPTARTWVQSVEGAAGVSVGVYYATSQRGAAAAKQVAQLSPKTGNGWELSNPFNVEPQMAGSEEGVREVRFVFANMNRSSDLRVWGLYVDPRMR
ncbi:MAG: hypothetical protein H0X42_03070 [Solirubrobacterales bacterium]|nr:hypothetical protein [Solirubrobacterales bacterium]